MEELACLQHQVRLSEVNLHHEVNQYGERDLLSEHMSTGGLPLYGGQTAQRRVYWKGGQDGGAIITLP